MADFSTARRMMVDGQIRTSDVTDLRIISAFQTVPRERFVAPSTTALAYLDIDVPVAEGDDARRMLKPMVLAKLIQAVEIAETDRVLIVGCTTGYSAAIIASLAGSVVALDEGVAPAQAVKTLSSLGVTNVEVVRGPLTAGWPAGAPYDVDPDRRRDRDDAGVVPQRSSKKAAGSFACAGASLRRRPLRTA